MLIYLIYLSIFLASSASLYFSTKFLNGEAAKLFQQLVSNHHAKEDMSRYFCSEIVAAGLRESGVLPKDINISEVTPIDLYTFNIYSDEYYFIKGDKQEIFKFNTVDPMTWEHMGCK